MGGYVAFEIMRQAPERVERLALLDTSATPDNPARAAERRKGVTSIKYGRFTGVTQTLLRQLVHPSKLDTPIGVGVRAMSDRVGGEAFLRQQNAIEHRVDSRPLLAGITVPTLVAVGDSDALTPPHHSRLMHELIAGSNLHVFQACGHLPPVEVPEETCAVLRRWLGGTSRTRGVDFVARRRGATKRGEECAWPRAPDAIPLREKILHVQSGRESLSLTTPQPRFASKHWPPKWAVHRLPRWLLNLCSQLLLRKTFVAREFVHTSRTHIRRRQHRNGCRRIISACCRRNTPVRACTRKRTTRQRLTYRVRVVLAVPTVA